eukprot:3936608-Rhodomonas_salina.1
MLSALPFDCINGPLGRNTCVLPSTVGADKAISTSSARATSPLTPISFSFRPTRRATPFAVARTKPWLAVSMKVCTAPVPFRVMRTMMGCNDGRWTCVVTKTRVLAGEE